MVSKLDELMSELNGGGSIASDNVVKSVNMTRSLANEIDALMREHTESCKTKRLKPSLTTSKLMVRLLEFGLDVVKNARVKANESPAISIAEWGMKHGFKLEPYVAEWLERTHKKHNTGAGWNQLVNSLLRQGLRQVAPECEPVATDYL